MRIASDPYRDHATVTRPEAFRPAADAVHVDTRIERHRLAP